MFRKEKDNCNSAGRGVQKPLHGHPNALLRAKMKKRATFSERGYLSNNVPKNNEPRELKNKTGRYRKGRKGGKSKLYPFYLFYKK